MEVIAGVLFAFAAVRTCSTHDVHFKTPISLAVLGADLHSLEKTFASPRSWPESALINYNDQVKFFVRLYPHSREGNTIIEVDGELTVARSKRSGSYELDNFRNIQTLLLHNGLFHFEDPTSQPVQNPGDYYIVHYGPPKRNTDQLPVIDYVPKNQFERQLMGSVENIFYESILSGAEVIRTYFLTNGGVKVHANYYEKNGTIVFEADFYFVYSTNTTELIEKSDRWDTLTYYCFEKSFPRISSLGTVFGVRVATTSQPNRTDSAEVIKISRQLLLKDVQQSKPAYDMSIMNVFGMIKYDSNRIFTLNYIEMNGKIVLRYAGRFVTQDGDRLCCICVATPEALPGTGNISSANSVLFSCPPENSGIVQILLREETEYIEMEAGYTVVMIRKKPFLEYPYRIEPYLEYITYEQFLQTLEIVSEAMLIRCANGFYRRSYRLFVNVFLVYDCNTRKAWFDKLDLWFNSDQQESLLTENVSGVTYDSKSRRFELKNEPLTFFRLRQPHAIFPEKIPLEMQYMYDKCYGKIDVAVDLRSVEWDMYNMRQNIMSNILPTTLVCVDDDELFHVEESQSIVDGVEKSVVMIKGVSDSCTPDGCVGEYDILYDGSKMITRNTRGLEVKVPASVYVPKTSKLSFMKDMMCADQERYIVLSTFRDDMRDLSEMLQKRCVELQGKPQYDEKWTIYVYYFGSGEPMIGYYDCMLRYIFFFSDFKVIKYPSVPGRTTSYVLGEELKVIPYFEGHKDDLDLIDSSEKLDDPEEIQLRGKYSDYIVRDLMYDQKEKTFHSRSMFFNEVFALRLLPGRIKAASSPKGGFQLKLKRRPVKAIVYGQDAPKTAWL